MSNKKFKQFTYEVIEENKDNPLETRVKKSNINVEFAMHELDTQQANLLKYLDEIRGKLNIEDAKMQNVTNNHEDAINLVKDLDPVKQEAIRIWLNSKSIVDQLGPKRDQFEEALEEHNAEVKYIIEVTGWEPPKEDAQEDKQENSQADDESSEAGGESESK